MIASGLESKGRLRRRVVMLDDGSVAYKSEWMESGEAPQLSPTVFLVEQAPGSTLKTHFHRQNEFQVVVQGTAMLGRHPVRPYTVHYAGAYTGYGPLVAGPEGLAYFTMRAAFDTGTLTDVAQVLRGPKRQHHAAPVEPTTSSRLQALQAAEASDLLNRPGDAVYSGLHRLPPHGSMELQPTPGSAGMFAMVIVGSALARETSLQRWESIFLSSDETALALHAGASGCELLTMQIPLLDEAYSSQVQNTGSAPAFDGGAGVVTA